MKEGSLASTRYMRPVLPTKPTSSQVVLTVVRVDGVGIDGLSLSVRQIMQLVKVVTGGPGTSKRPFVNPTLSFVTSCSHRFEEFFKRFQGTHV